ncbi:MAG: thiamine-phosphate kinase [Bacteroidota bacterium]
MENTNRTELQSLGEFGLIRRISADTTLQNPESVRGIGDDAAVIDVGNQYLLLSTDMLVEGVHFDLSYVPLKHLGYKSVAVNVSDIAAMNGIPKQIVVGLALSNRFSAEAIDELYEGIRAACRSYQVDLVGGDTTSSSSGLIISISVTGLVDKEKVVLRSTARPNDVICVTGDLGGAYVGLQLLEREKRVFLTNPDMQPELQGKDYMLERQLRPEARMDFIHELRDLGVVPTSMIDISDGLASELLHICTQSGVGANIFEEKIPISPLTYDNAVELSLDPITCALNGGEDYELLFTINQSDYDKIKNLPDVAFVGYVTDQPQAVNLITSGGNTYAVKAQGWEHF